MTKLFLQLTPRLPIVLLVSVALLWSPFASTAFALDDPVPSAGSARVVGDVPADAASDDSAPSDGDADTHLQEEALPLNVAAGSAGAVGGESEDTDTDDGESDSPASPEVVESEEVVAPSGSGGADVPLEVEELDVDVLLSPDGDNGGSGDDSDNDNEQEQRAPRNERRGARTATAAVLNLHGNVFDPDAGDATTTTPAVSAVYDTENTFQLTGNTIDQSGTTLTWSHRTTGVPAGYRTTPDLDTTDYMTGGSTLTPTIKIASATSPIAVPAGEMYKYRLRLSSIDGGNIDTISQAYLDLIVRDDTAPTAAAGANRDVDTGITVTLDGSGSVDASGASATPDSKRTDGFTATGTGTVGSYQWHQVDAAASDNEVTSGGTNYAALTGANTATPTFTAPSTAKTIHFRLTVTDGFTAKTAKDWVSITTVNRPSAVQGLTATPALGSITLNWTEHADTNVSGYEYQKCDADGTSGCDASWTLVSGKSTTTAIITVSQAADAVTAPTNTYKVRAVRGSDRSYTNCVVTPSTPRTACISAAPQYDYDIDDDNLIEIRTLAQFNALRYDYNGDGTVTSAAISSLSTDHKDTHNTGWDSSFRANYNLAFPDSPTNKCPSTCLGYELHNDLDFDTNKNGRADSGDTYWNEGGGFYPIGEGGTVDSQTGALGHIRNYHAILKGNGYRIFNLYINNPHYMDALWIAPGNRGRRIDYDHISLFAQLGTSRGSNADTLITGLGLVNASVRAGSVRSASGHGVGLLVGGMLGSVSNTYATGAVGIHHSIDGVDANAFGGLIGVNSAISHTIGKIRGVYTNVAMPTDTVLVGQRVQSVAPRSSGGIMGTSGIPGNSDELTASYAIGRTNRGLVGRSLQDIATTASYWDTQTTGTTSDNSNGGAGKTTSQLQTPTGYTGIYADWNIDIDFDTSTYSTGGTSSNGKDDPWDFGTNAQYPVLKSGGHTRARQTLPTFTTTAIKATNAFPDYPETEWNATSFNTGLATRVQDINTAMTLVLPQATGGDSTLTYELRNGLGGTDYLSTLPTGLTFDRDTRTISGSPTAITPEPVWFTWVAKEPGNTIGFNDETRFPFSIRVVDPATPPATLVLATDTDSIAPVTTETPDLTRDTTPTIAFDAIDNAAADITAAFTGKPPGAAALSNTIPVSTTGASPTLAVTAEAGATDAYTLRLPTLSVDGEYTVEIQVGTNAAAKASYTFTLDTTGATPTITFSKSRILTGTETVTVDFGESVTGFIPGNPDNELTITAGATLSNFSGSGQLYTATLTPDANTEATVTLAVAADTAVDLAGNDNVAGSATVDIDTTPLGVAVFEVTDGVYAVADDPTHADFPRTKDNVASGSCTVPTTTDASDGWVDYTVVGSTVTFSGDGRCFVFKDTDGVQVAAHTDTKRPGITNFAVTNANTVGTVRYTSDTTPAFTGAVATDTVVKVYNTLIGGTAIATDTASSDSFTAITDPALAAGRHPIYTTITPVSGTESIKIHQFDIVVDDTTPTLSAVSIASDNADPAYAKVGDTITLSFTADERLSTSGSAATIAGASATIAEISATDFTYTATLLVSGTTTEGAVTFSITPQDDTRNAPAAVTATTDSTTMTVDRTAPVVSIFEKANSTVYAYANETLHASTGAVSKDAVASGSCDTTTTTDSTWTDYTPRRAPVAVDATAGRCFVFTDPAGNKTVAHSSDSISEDTNLEFTGAGLFDGKYYTNSTTPAFTGSTEADATVKVYETGFQSIASGNDIPTTQHSFASSSHGDAVSTYLIGDILDTAEAQDITFRHPRGTKGILCPFWPDSSNNPVTSGSAWLNISGNRRGGCVGVYNIAGESDQFTETTYTLTLTSKMRAAKGVVWYTGPYNASLSALPTYRWYPLNELSTTERGSATADGTSNADGTRNYTGTISPAFTVGEKSIYTGITPSGATAESDEFAALTLVVDTTAPAAPTLISASGASGADTTPAFTVTAEAGASVQLYTDDSCDDATGTAATVAVGDTTVDVETGTLGIGSHLIYATQTDPAGNASDCSASGAAYEQRNITAAISTSNRVTLTESNLNDATVTVTITSTIFSDSLDITDFRIDGIAGLTTDHVSRTDDTNAVLTLDFTPRHATDFDTDDSFTVTVLSAGHNSNGDLTTGSKAVTAVTETVTAAVAAHAPATINGDNLNDAQIDVTLNSARFVSGNPETAHFIFSGITGLSADGAIRVDDDTVRLTLNYTGTPLTANDSFTVAINADAHDNALAVTSASFSVPASLRLDIDLAAASDTGVSDTDNETKDDTPTFTITLPGNRQFGGFAYNTVRIYRQSGACAGLTLPTGRITFGSSHRDWAQYGTTSVGTVTTSVNITGSALAAGTHCFFTFIARDNTWSDFATHSNPLEVVIDTTAPAAAPTVIALSDPSTTPGTDDTLEVEVTAPVGSIVQIYTDRQCTAASRTGTDRVTVPSDGTATLTTGTLAEGTHTIYAATVDVAGNVNCFGTGVDYTVEYPVTLAASTPLTEANLDGATVTLTIGSGETFNTGTPVSTHFAIDGPTGLTATNPTLTSDTVVTLTLAFTGDFDTDQTLSFTVNRAAHSGSTELDSSTLTIAANHADELQNPVATAGDEEVTLRWTRAPETVTGYEYRQKAGSGNYGSWTTMSGVTGTDTKSYTVTGLTNATAYTFEIRAVVGADKGAASAEVSATPVDSTAPTLSVVSVISDNTDTAYAKVGDTITLSFTASERLSTSGTSVTIAGRTGGNVTVNEVSASDFTYTATTTVASGTTQGAVTFSITPQDTVGNNGTAYTAVTDTSDVTVDTAAPVVSVFEKVDDTIYAYANETLHATATIGAVSKDAVLSGSCSTALTAPTTYTSRTPVAVDATNGRCFVFTDPAGNKTAAHSSAKISEDANLVFTGAGSFDSKSHTNDTTPAFTGSIGTTGANAEVTVYEQTEQLAYSGAAPNPTFYYSNSSYFAGYAIVGNIYDTPNSQSITLNHHQGATRGFLCPYITPIPAASTVGTDPDCIELYNNGGLSGNKVEHTYAVTLNSAMLTANAVLWRIASYNSDTAHTYRYAPLYEHTYTERGSATADGDGVVSGTISTAFNAGENNVYTGITPSGTTVESDRFSALTLVVDEIAPAVPTLVSASGTSGTDTTPTFRVTAEAGARVQLYTNSLCTAATGTAATVAAGGTTVDVETGALGIGSHTIYAKQTDPAGNASDCSASASYQVTAPAAAAISTSSPLSLDESNLNNATVTVTLTGTTFTDPLNTAHFSVGGIAGLTADGVSRTNDTTADLTLDFTAGHATDFDTDDSFTVTVLGAGRAGNGNLTTGSKSVTAVTETVTASVAAHTPATIDGSNLNNAQIDVTLNSARFVSGNPDTDHFNINGTGVTGLTADAAARHDDDTVRLTLDYTGAELTTASSFTVEVAAAAHDNASAVTSSSFSVPASSRLALDLAAASDTGVSDTDDETKDTTPSFTVTRPVNRQFGTSGDTVHIFTAETACADTAAPTAAVTVASPPTGWVPYGTHTLTAAVTTTDITGSAISATTRCFFAALSNGTTTDFATHSPTLEVVIDTTAPAPSDAPTAIALNDPNTTPGTDDTLEVEVTANDGSAVQIYTDNQCTDASRTGTDRETVPTTGGPTGTVTLTTGTLSIGEHTIYAATVDTAGNARCLTTGAAYTVEHPVILAASTPATLTEANLDGAQVTLTIQNSVGRTFNTGTLNIPHFVPSGPTGLTVSAVTRDSNTVVTLTLAFTGDFDTDQTLSFTVDEDAIHSGTGDLTTSSITIAANHADELQNPTAAAGNEQVTLSWTQAPETGATYEYRQKAGSGNYGVWTTMSGITTSGNTKSYTVTGLTNGTAYTFEIRAVTSGGDGVPSAEVSATPTSSASAAPTNVTLASDASSITPYTGAGTHRTRDTTPTISFTAVSGATTEVEYKEGSGGTFTTTGVTHTGTGAATTRTAVLPTLSTNGIYRVRITQDEDGSGDTNTPTSVTYSFILDTQAPTVTPTVAKNGAVSSGGTDYLNTGDTLTVTFTFDEDMSATVLAGKFINDGTDIPSSGGSHHTVTPARTNATTQTLTLTVTDAGPDVAANTLEYHLTNGTSLTDLAGNALVAQDKTAIADTVIDTTAPVPAFINDVSDPATAVDGVRSDTILVSADEAGFTGYGYSDDTTCDSGDSYTDILNKPLTHLQRITTDANNDDYLCYRAADIAGNTAYLVSAHALDINTALTNSDDAELSDLSLSAGTLTPALIAGTHAYTATVANSVTTVTVTADPNNDEALITSITADTDGSVENGVVDLTVGNNIITITVTAQDGTATQDYTVTVTRYGTDTRPDGFSFSAETDVEPSAEVTSDPVTPSGFDAPTTFSVTTGATLVVNDTDDRGESGTVNPGESLRLKLTASSSWSTAKTATLTLDGTVSGTFSTTTRAARTNANLSALTVSGVTLSFDADTTSYTGSVANSVAQVTVTHTAADAEASVTVTPADDNGDTAGHQVRLAAGDDTIIRVEVTAEDGSTTKEYRVTVTRAASASAAPGSPTLAQEAGGIAPYTASGTHRTRDTTPTISFTAVSGATTEVEYHQGNTGVFTGTGVTHTSSGTTRTAVLPTLSTNGIYRVRITQDEDGSGGPKTPTAVTYSFILDTQAPTVTPTVAKNGHTTAGSVDYLNTGDTLTVTFTFDEDMSATVLTGKFINNGTDIPSSGANRHTITPARTNATTQTLTLTVTDAGPDVAANALEYHLTNGASLTDLAGNAFTAQDETAIANTVIDTTAPTLSPTKTGTDNTATYKVAATDNSPVTGRTKDAVALADCTDSTDTATWDTYTPGADTGAADDDDGRCVIITDAAGNTAAQHLDDDDDIPSDFTLDITGDGAVGTYDAIAHYIYEVFKAQAPNGRQAMTPFLTGGDDAATVWSRLQASAATRDFSGNGDTDQQDAIIHYIYEVFKDQEPNGRQAMTPFLTGAGANTGAAVFTLLNGYAGR